MCGPCEFTTDLARAGEADAIVVHMPTAPPLDGIAAQPGQIWVAFSMESEVTVPAMADPVAMARFDVEVSYRRTADVWTPRFGRASLPALRAPPVAKTAAYPVAHFQSNPMTAAGATRPRAN